MAFRVLVVRVRLSLSAKEVLPPSAVTGEKSIVRVQAPPVASDVLDLHSLVAVPPSGKSVA